MGTPLDYGLDLLRQPLLLHHPDPDQQNISDAIKLLNKYNWVINSNAGALDCEKLAKIYSRSFGMHDSIDAF